MFERQTNSDETLKKMKVTKKQIKENTLSTELQSNGRFERRFKHYFEFKVDQSEGKKFHKITFSMIGCEIDVTTYWNRLNEEPGFERLHTHDGKIGFINEVFDYINSL